MVETRCTNFGECTKADSKEIVAVADGADMICPECRKPSLRPVGGKTKGTGGPSTGSGAGKFPLVPVLAGLAAILIIGFGLRALMGGGAKPAPPSQTVGGAGAGGGGRDGKNPQPPIQPKPDPASTLMYFEKSGEKWIEGALADFAVKEPGAKIVPDYRGSREGRDDILYGRAPVVIWNPADTYWTEKLREDANNPRVRGKSGATIGNDQVILKTHLVLAMAPDRAELFQKALASGPFRGRTWALMHALATRGWATIGGPPTWGTLKLAQSNPLLSNSGMVALALMFAEYRGRNLGMRDDDPGFLRFMGAIEASAGNSFAKTTGVALDNLVANTERYDVAIAYETNAIQQIDKKGQASLKIVYPDPTMEVRFPVAVVKASWVSDQQQAIGQKLIECLLTREVQERSINFGFRPAESTLRSKLDDAFSTPTRQNAGVLLEPTVYRGVISTETKDGLIFQWKKWYRQTYGQPAVGDV